MFDETTDVQMRSLLNLFTNVLFKNGKFKTLTLTLSELEANDAGCVYKKILTTLASTSSSEYALMAARLCSGSGRGFVPGCGRIFKST